MMHKRQTIRFQLQPQLDILKYMNQMDQMFK